MGRGNAGKIGAIPPPQAQAAGPPTIRIETYPMFGFAVQRAGEDGQDRILSIFKPDGVRFDFPLDSEAAKQLSERLLAPSVPGSTGIVVPGEE